MQEGVRCRVCEEVRMSVGCRHENVFEYYSISSDGPTDGPKTFIRDCWNFVAGMPPA